jgi:hypothetical protein
MQDDIFIDVSKITDARTALICARLRLRGAKRRLQKGPTPAAIAALYDSVLFGMRYYIAKHSRCASLVENIDLWDAANLFLVLARAGVFDDPLSFNRFSLSVERALWQGSVSFNVNAILIEVEAMLKKLGVMSFDDHMQLKKSGISH